MNKNKKSKIIKALAKSGYTDSDIAELLGMTPRVLRYNYKEELALGKQDLDIENAKIVATLATCGYTQEDIALVLNVSVDTLTKKYKDLLRVARLKTISKAASHIIKNAISDSNTKEARADRYFFLKTQGKWRETSPIQNNINTGSDYKIVISEHGSTGEIIETELNYEYPITIESE